MVFVLGTKPGYRDLVALARLVIQDRETPAEAIAWQMLSDWERRHYMTRAEETMRERQRPR